MIGNRYIKIERCLPVNYLRFNDVYDLRIRTTMVSDRYIEGMNAVALKRI